MPFQSQYIGVLLSFERTLDMARIVEMKMKMKIGFISAKRHIPSNAECEWMDAKQNYTAILIAINACRLYRNG